MAGGRALWVQMLCRTYTVSPKSSAVYLAVRLHGRDSDSRMADISMRKGDFLMGALMSEGKHPPESREGTTRQRRWHHHTPDTPEVVLLKACEL